MTAAQGPQDQRATVISKVQALPSGPRPSPPPTTTTPPPMPGSLQPVTNLNDPTVVAVDQLTRAQLPELANTQLTSVAYRSTFPPTYRLIYNMTNGGFWDLMVTYNAITNVVTVVSKNQALPSGPVPTRPQNPTTTDA